MRLLLDSHIIVWWLADSPRLPASARAAIRDPSNEVFISAASVWELGLKMSRGKLELPLDFIARLRRDGFNELAITSDHALGAMRLPPHHGDPFDRLLISQALAEGLILATQDAQVGRYTVPLLPN